MPLEGVAARTALAKAGKLSVPQIAIVVAPVAVEPVACVESAASTATLELVQEEIVLTSCRLPARALLMLTTLPLGQTANGAFVQVRLAVEPSIEQAESITASETPPRDRKSKRLNSSH